MAKGLTTVRWQDARNELGTTTIQLLAGDVGGTKSWLAWVELAWQQPVRTVFEQRYASQDFPDALSLLRKFIQDTGRGLPDRMCLAMPGPVEDGRVRLTNLDWQVDADELSVQLAIPDVRLINDFQAAAAGVETLRKTDWRVINPGIPRLGATRVITGAGTGLGVAWMQSVGSADWKVYPSEGGHMDFAPADERQAKLLAWLARRHSDHVSWERLLSGSGLSAMHAWLDDNAAGESLLPADEIHTAALAGEPVATAAIELFCDIYAAWTGNLAVTFQPQGGLFLAGGMGIHLQDWIMTSRFREIMISKGRMSPLVGATPVYLVTNPRLGLQGAILSGHNSG